MQCDPKLTLEASGTRLGTTRPSYPNERTVLWESRPLAPPAQGSCQNDEMRSISLERSIRPSDRATCLQIAE